MESLIENTTISYGLHTISHEMKELVVWLSNADGKLKYDSHEYHAPWGTTDTEIDGYYPITIFVREAVTSEENLPIVVSNTMMIVDATEKYAAIFLVLLDAAGIKDRKRRNTTVKVTSGGGGD